MRHPASPVLAALVLCVLLLCALPARAQVVDDIEVTQNSGGLHLRIVLTSPVHYIRHHPPEQGERIDVTLQALAPGDFGTLPTQDEEKISPQIEGLPQVYVRVSRDPRCDTAPNPICMAIRFDRPVNYRVRLSENRRALLLDIGGPVAPAEQR